MRRFLLLIPAAAVAGGALLSAACYHAAQLTGCNVRDGSATVSSPTGVFGPPNFDDVVRNYVVHASCEISGDPDQPLNIAVRSQASYTPDSKSATEEISSRNFDLVSTWNACSGDPWLTAGVTCTNASFELKQGQLPSGLNVDKRAPLTAELLGPADRSKIAADLMTDFANKMKQFPNTCNQSATEFNSVIVAPTANATFLSSQAVPLNVHRSAGCTPALDGVQPRFDLEWQVQDPGMGQFTDISIVPSFDGVANPNGTMVSASVFAPFLSPLLNTHFRVRARLSGTSAPAPFSDFTPFAIGPQ